ncbi:TBC1 domain family member 1-like [Acanthaster planci]|uniref:TBC1 domain family member 4 n=1 Tax=Acanthaster planci TaxID=133434 RepID=A0A8B7XUC5_ACAPL|nr:TBC1 domain family member 1-like [Acanthaster planci]
MSQRVPLASTKKALSVDSGLRGGGKQPNRRDVADRTRSVDSTINKKATLDPLSTKSARTTTAPVVVSADEEATMPVASVGSADSLSGISNTASHNNGNASDHQSHEEADSIIGDMTDSSKMKMRTSLASIPRDRRSKMLDTHPVIMKGWDVVDGAGGGGGSSGGGGTTKAVFKMKYYGNVQLDRRITQPMLPWIIANKRRQAGNGQNLILQVSSRGAIGISESKGSIVFEHLPQSITRFSRGHNKKCFAYLWRPDSESSFHCFVFETSDPEVVHQIASSVRDASKEAVKYDVFSKEEKAGVEAIENLRINNATMFEVMYCGRVTVTHKRAPPTLIDDTIEKFNVHEMETRKKRLGTRKRHFSFGDQNGTSPVGEPPEGSTESDRLSSEDTTSSVSSDSLVSSPPNVLDTDGDTASNSSRASQQDTQLSPVARDRVSSAGAAVLKHHNVGHTDSTSSTASISSTAANGESVTSGHNRTMLFQIGKSMLTLISPDKKSFMLTKKFNEISFCSQGIKQPEFFGFICREKTSSSSYMCYVFKCQSEPVVDSIMTTLRQSFNVALQKSKLHVICGTCPMHQLHKLCQTIEGQPPEKAHTVLLKQLDTLSDSERIAVITKTKEAKATSAQEANEIIMSQLIAICEQQQNSHIHNSDTEAGGEPPSSSPMQERKLPSKGSCTETAEGKVGAFKKAKKSLASSFENLLSRKKKNSTEEPGSFANSGYRSRQGTMDSVNSDSSLKESPRDSPIPMAGTSSTQPNPPIPIVTSSTPNAAATTPPSKPIVVDIPTPPPSEDKPSRPSPILCKQDSLPEPMFSPTVRPRSKTLGDTPSPSPKTPPPDSRFQYMNTNSVANQVNQKPTQMQKMPLGRTTSAFYDDRPRTLSLSPFSPHPAASMGRRMSWRQQIFNRVVTPIAESKLGQELPEEDSEDVFEGDGIPKIRGLERQESLTRPKRFATKEQIRELWRKAIREQILLIRMDKENRNLQARQDAAQEKRIKLDYEEITPCLKEVTVTWEKILSRPNRSSIRLSKEEVNDTFKQGIPKTRRGEIWQFICEQQKLNGLTNGNVPQHEPYKELLKELTIHQHAILIDLGRTFPTHPYFANPLGRGQLSLFNLLKAYSLLDTDVGYCQGLSFVAGVLLMHMDEEQSFEMLVFLMYSLGFRRQYKPDMIALQIQMYQLSRLLHDFHKRLYDHLEQNEISPSLYAAPWFLTLFASQFPLGFVAKVFDLIFLQGFDVIFKVALIVLGSHEELLLHCDGFEAIIEFLKDTLPTLGIIQMENVINKAYQLDISKELHAYEVEYHMLQEEMAPSPVHQRTQPPTTDIHKLETANRNLRRHNSELLEQLQSAHTTIHSQEATIHNLRKNEDKLKSEVRALNLERSALLNTVAKLRSLLPKDVVLEDAGINFTPSSSASFLSGSSFDDKDAASPMDQKADSGTGNLSGSQTCSPDETDTEVASINSTPKGTWGRNHSNGSSGSEISTSTSSDMDGPSYNQLSSN